MSATRTEIDLLDSMEVPTEAYYGIHTQHAIDNYQISGKTINDVPGFIRGTVMVKKTTATANQCVHTLPSDVAEATVAACDEILEKGRYMDQFPIDVFRGGAGTSINTNTNEVIANFALELLGQEKGRYDVIHPNDDVNQCQSTSDAYPTGFRLAVHVSLLNLQKHFDSLVGALHAKGDEFNDIITMGRTQLQDAVPTTLGQMFCAFANNLEEEQESIATAPTRLPWIGPGAAAIGTGVNALVGYREAATQALREVSGFDVSSAKDLIEATSDTGAYVSVHACLKRAAMKISKMCNDLRLLASSPRAGLNEISLPEHAAGSSIIPAKANLVIPEVTNQACFKVFGNDATLTWAIRTGQLQLSVMEPVIGACFFETIGLLRDATDTPQDRCITDIAANADVCCGYVDDSIGIVTYLNPVIGHYEGDMVGKEAARTGRSVRDIVLERGLMDESEFDRVLSTENLIHLEYRGKRYVTEGPRLDNLS